MNCIQSSALDLSSIKLVIRNDIINLNLTQFIAFQSELLIHNRYNFSHALYNHLRFRSHSMSRINFENGIQSRWIKSYGKSLEYILLLKQALWQAIVAQSHDLQGYVDIKKSYFPLDLLLLAKFRRMAIATATKCHLVQLKQNRLPLD